MSLKRKHVVFTDDDATGDIEMSAPAEVQTLSGSAGVHPDRVRMVDGVAPRSSKPKTKSDKKKQYIAKKQRKQRKMKAARKASTKSETHYQGAEEDEDSDSDLDEEADGESEDVKDKPTTTSVEELPKPAPAPVDDRTRRKEEKRAKRDARRDERKQRRKNERLNPVAAEEEAETGGDLSGEREDEDEDMEDEEDREDGAPTQEEEDGNADDYDDREEEYEGDIPDLPTRLSRSPSPPMLEPFPLPTMAPAPDAAVLSRQGMPTGLEDAAFIDQDMRIGVSALAADLPGSSGLSERTQKRLAEVGVEEFFAVQAAILPHLLSLPLVPLPHAQLHDYLISAPTGSGKTLAYAVPIVELLAKRIVPRLRALIVLPTRELVVQVRETLEALAKGTGLLIGSVTGQHSFAHEQAQLLADADEQLIGGSSKLDILIATPGRLMDHLTSTPNFTLQHLRFLVIDEADRLLTQSFQNWLVQVLKHIRAPSQKAGGAMAPYDAVAPSWIEPLGLASGEFEGSEVVPSTCQKLLFSATLTRDPAKVAALDLTSPQYFIVQSSQNPQSAMTVGSSFALPAELSERALILPPALKPLNLIHLLHGVSSGFGTTPALVFTKSVESASRLVKLLTFFEDAYTGGKHITVRGYTRDMPPAERKRLLKDFASGDVDVLVASDLVARGMDLPTVEHVISYDIPLDMTKYVHRAGRTARAGRSGTAWTLVEKQEALHWKGMLRGAGHEGRVKKVKVQEADVGAYKDSYEIAMKRLREVYGRD